MISIVIDEGEKPVALLTLGLVTSIKTVLPLIPLALKVLLWEGSKDGHARGGKSINRDGGTEPIFDSTKLKSYV